MNTTKTTIASTQGCSTLVRARFGPGMLLQHEDLEQLTTYTQELSRLLFRSFFGCGVICGLVVSSDAECGKVYVNIGSGVALDCVGNPIYVPKDQRFALDNDCNPDLAAPLWVILCSSLKCCAPRTSMCSCDDDSATSTCTRERDCFEIRVVSKLPDCVCGCPKPRKTLQSDCRCVNPADDCYKDHYAGICGCTCSGGSSCDCNCVVLAVLNQQPDSGEWKADHSVRRFIRPALMRDPEIADTASDDSDLVEALEELGKGEEDEIKETAPKKRSAKK
jgi:hypothetical protein